MMTREARQAIFKRGKPKTLWEGEPMLGSIYGEEEIEAVVEAIRDSMEVSRGFGGQKIAEFETAFAQYIGTKHAIAVNSAGPGLDMAMRYLKLEPGDEVIVPAINFVASPMAVIGAGGQVIWGEVNPKTLQLDPNDVEKRITPRTRAIFPVHMNGLAAPMADFLELAKRYPHEKHGPLAVIGDVARACGGEYQGEKLGKKGLMSVFSFHTMKNMVTLGEGGMVVTDDDDAAAFCRSTRFYGWNETGVWGSSHVMTKIQAAAGLVQLKKLDGFIAMRRRLAHRRNEMLSDVPELQLPYEPPDCLHTYYLYTCILPESWAGEKRDNIMKMMDEEFGVRLLVANPPVYTHQRFVRDHTPGQSLPLSESLGRRLFCVPTHPGMSDEDNEYIAAALIECIERLR
ncbi:MAG TPA: DegT/DnrJ/EryC1/StrS family aminotransferase [Candidatus Hydrogenedentes bacterium]|mgnify:CR=1 FL=1|nr:DegT/DnrJ/EryC1/StrS family aminotransferase [Candidatus Hydrogenedentota bacterium]HOV73431.1 DegT/DnrJ/EryC1/StrS family aminotransferase [Candidatus Hydrogenedentota bacterium]HPC17811.1 DegT/DnrJ/EryC1/StrS family aminotransferase [Candidatus Hydrogenedentota bacterium]HRT20674.1 DegT/DnrJ/EryC1/StrS family aminotransferase [Candidatus Hydrogenedentota bacterium]HRT65710.1 DegT/DnrJ/EryC1/StrS family aminotransferase [Candidatus Hydrogenedentota bacterium]